ncbi:MAG: hypothetical protein GY792_29480 [Gammaproteobacteria bacterium]|nr:hypothetical protein [Gammaproteobacteria bacterium]
MTSAPKIFKLDQTVSLFNQGRASFQLALGAKEANNFSEAETALISAARDVADSLEWALKVYLNNIPKLSGEDRRKLRHPNFHGLLTLMKKYADPPLPDDMSRQMYGYRDMRNEATHKGAIPPVEEVRIAIEGVGWFLHTYFQIKLDGSNKDAAADSAVDSSTPTPSPVTPAPSVERKSVPAATSLTPSRRRRLAREQKDLEEHIEGLSDKISALRRELRLENRSEERMRLEAVIQDNEKLLAEFGSKLDDIERQLG